LTWWRIIISKSAIFIVDWLPETYWEVWIVKTTMSWYMLGVDLWCRSRTKPSTRAWHVWWYFLRYIRGTYMRLPGRKYNLLEGEWVMSYNSKIIVEISNCPRWKRRGGEPIRTFLRDVDFNVHFYGFISEVEKYPVCFEKFSFLLVFFVNVKYVIAVEFKWTNIGTKTDLQSNRGNVLLELY